MVHTTFCPKNRLTYVSRSWATIFSQASLPTNSTADVTNFMSIIMFLSPDSLRSISFIIEESDSSVTVSIANTIFEHLELNNNLFTPHYNEVVQKCSKSYHVD